MIAMIIIAHYNFNYYSYAVSRMDALVTPTNSAHKETQGGHMRTEKDASSEDEASSGGDDF